MAAADDSSRPAPSASSPTLAPAVREQAVQVLTRLYAEDRLGEAELEARLDRVYRATSLAELRGVLADLRPDAAAPTDARPAEPQSADVREVSALLSGQQIRHTGPVPPRLRLRARLGYVELDLTRASFAPGTTEIEVDAFLGYVQVRLPAAVRVESMGHAVLGYFSLLGGRKLAGPPPDAPFVRLTGRAALGFAECYISSRKLDSPGRGPRLEPGQPKDSPTES